MSDTSQQPRYRDEEYESEWELSDEARDQVALLENPDLVRTDE